MDPQRITQVLSALLSPILPGAAFRVTPTGQVEVRRGEAAISFHFDAFVRLGLANRETPPADVLTLLLAESIRAQQASACRDDRVAFLEALCRIDPELDVGVMVPELLVVRSGATCLAFAGDAMVIATFGMSAAERATFFREKAERALREHENCAVLSSEEAEVLVRRFASP